MYQGVPDEFNVYMLCTLPYRASDGRNPALTIDEFEGTPPLPEEEVYAGPLVPEESARVAKLCGYFGYTYAQARAFSPGWAGWFIAFREEVGI